MTTAPEYGLGHTTRELDRLEVQARMLEPFTHHLFMDAGIEPGMRVLDVGSGVGDTAFVAARIVGDQGEVLGTDRVDKALDVARQRAEELSLGNVTFVQGDPTQLSLGPPFDAVIGRYVLAWQKDPGSMLSRLIPKVRPGGIVVFHELEWASARSFPSVSSWDRCCQLAVEGMTAGGADLQVGMKLHTLYLGAGLPSPSMRYGSLIGSTLDHVRLTTDIVATLLPDMERSGLVEPGEIHLGTLGEDVLADITSSGSTVVGRSEIGAWSRRP